MSEALQTVTRGTISAFEPSNLKEAHQLFDVLIKTKYLPQHITTPQQAIAIWLLARERDIPMMTALTRMYVVHGTPSMDSALMVALVRSSGKCEVWQVVESTDTKAAICTQRFGGKPTTITYTMDDAKRMGLAGKDQYVKQPAVMLLHRCEAKAARQEYQDVIGGMLTHEEAEEVRPKIDANVVLTQILDEQRQSLPPAAPQTVIDADPEREPEPVKKPEVTTDAPIMRPVERKPTAEPKCAQDGPR